MTEQLLHPCIEWEGTRASDGYGVTRIGKGQNYVKAHRVAYCIEHGLDLPDIKGMLIRHKCDNPPCVQPSHLELGTPQDNMDDKVKRGRCPRGSDIKVSVLTEDDVLRIRKDFVKGSGEFGIKGLSIKYGVSMRTISMAVYRETWRHI